MRWTSDLKVTNPVAVRQNLDLIVDGGVPVAGLDDNTGNRWGKTVGNKLFVTFAKQDENAEDEVAGISRGFVDMFDLDGNLLGHVEHVDGAARGLEPQTQFFLDRRKQRRRVGRR